MKIPLTSEFELGEPWKLIKNGAGVAVPILSVEKSHFPRGYRLLSEIKGGVQLKDTGSIDRLHVTNASDKVVFIRKGSIIKGDTQTRALTLSIMVAPQSKTEADIKCVYASKGIRSGTSFEFSGKYTPQSVTSKLRESQSETWKAVTDHTFSMPNVYSSLNGSPLDNEILNRLRREAGTDNLEGFLRVEEKVIDDAMKSIPVDHIRQVGLVVVDLKGVAGVELFDHPDSWKALSQEVVRNYSEILASMAPDIFDINMEKVKQLVNKFLVDLRGMDGIVAFKENGFHTYEIAEGGFVGEFTTMNGRLIHVLVTRAEKQENPSYVLRRESINLHNRVTMYDDVRLSPRIIRNQEVPELGKRMESSYNDKEVKIIQDQAALTIDYLTKKRGYETIISLKDGPKTFNELQKKTSMSTATVAKAIKEAEELRLVQRSYNRDTSSTMYELTDTGKSLQPEKFKTTIED